MGVGSGGEEAGAPFAVSCIKNKGGRGPPPPTPQIFIHDTDKVDGGLMVLFFGLFFYCPLVNFSAKVLDYNKILNFF